MGLVEKVARPPCPGVEGGLELYGLLYYNRVTYTMLCYTIMKHTTPYYDALICYQHAAAHALRVTTSGIGFHDNNVRGGIIMSIGNFRNVCVNKS